MMAFHFLSTRFVLSRLKRCLITFTLLSVIMIITISFMTLLNRSNLGLALSGAGEPIAGRLRPLGSGLTGRRRTARPMVQFYPDSQYKMLYRKSQDEGEDFNSELRLDLTADEETVRMPTTMKLDPLGEPEQQGQDVLKNVHIFYYGWYENPSIDGQWSHWNHEYLPNWDTSDKRKYPTGQHDPTIDDIGANFFPQLGAYSSTDPAVLKVHMKQIRQAGAGVVVFSWYPPNRSDPNGKPVDAMVPSLLDAAKEEGLKVALHIEPYKNRTIRSLKEDLKYVKSEYFNHPAFYKEKSPRGGQGELPVYYIYDSYLTSPIEWGLMLDRHGTSKYNIRGTDLDGIFIGLLVDYKHRTDIKAGQFDGFYTYFAANGFSHGSSWKNWRSLQKFATRSNLLFCPSIGPGYIDTRVRPWNSKNMRNRRKGEYYDMAWKSAMAVAPKFVSITSFNEWHEGTQIEPAVPKKITSSGYEYLSYLPDGPAHYLDVTRNWVNKYAELLQSGSAKSSNP